MFFLFLFFSCISVQVASRIGEGGHPQSTNRLCHTAYDMPSIPPSEGPSRSLIHAESPASVIHRARESISRR
ncbi:hypothetical protein ACQKWADRAFT_277259 [Trichoderma austrokoningii]